MRGAVLGPVRLSALLVAVLVATSSLIAAQPALVHVRLVSAPNDDVTPVLYAISQGWFRQTGLDIDLQAAGSSGIVPAVIGGSADIGRVNLIPLISAHAHHVPIVLVAPSGLDIAGASADAIVVAAASPARTGRDLNGQTVAVPGLHDIADILAHGWIDRTGGDSASVKFVEAGGEEALVGLDASRLAAAVLVNPTMQQSIATGRYRALADPIVGLASKIMAAGWFARTDYAAQNPTVIRRFAEIVRRASAFCNEHPDQTVDLLAKFTGVSPDVIQQSSRDKYDLTLIPADIQPLIDQARKYKLIDQPFDARELIDTDALR